MRSSFPMQGLRHVPASAQPRSRHRRQRLSSTAQPGVAKAPSETPPRDQLCPKTTHRRDPKNRGSPERSTPTQGVRHRPHDEAASTPDSQHHSKLAFNTTPHRPEPRRHRIHRLDRRCPIDDISGRRVRQRSSPATPTPPHRSRSGTSAIARRSEMCSLQPVVWGTRRRPAGRALSDSPPLGHVPG